MKRLSKETAKPSSWSPTIQRPRPTPTEFCISTRDHSRRQRRHEPHETCSAQSHGAIPFASLLTMGSATVAVFLPTDLAIFRDITRRYASKRSEQSHHHFKCCQSVSEFAGQLCQQDQQPSGVESVSRWTWFGGYHKDPSNFLPISLLSKKSSMNSILSVFWMLKRKLRSLAISRVVSLAAAWPNALAGR